MIKIGVTGGIGSGKTTICAVFSTLGIPVFNTDAVAKQLMISDAVLIKEVTRIFGAPSYQADGRLNNSYIAGIVFNNPLELAKLNNIVHPAVFRAFEKWSVQQKHVPYILKESALLFESDAYKLCDKSIVVVASEKDKINRVVQRDGITEKQVLARMDKQFSDAEKIKRADYVIHNTNEQSIIMQVYQLHLKFIAINDSK